MKSIQEMFQLKGDNWNDCDTGCTDLVAHGLVLRFKREHLYNLGFRSSTADTEILTSGLQLREIGTAHLGSATTMANSNGTKYWTQSSNKNTLRPVGVCLIGREVYWPEDVSMFEIATAGLK
jgi:hypothetical protein